MSRKTSSKALTFIGSHMKKGGKIQLFGTEPLMNPSLVRKFITIGRALGYSSGMTTNGIGLTDSICEMLAYNRVGVLVSLDGMREPHNFARRYPSGGGSYDRVAQGIKRLNSHGIKPGIAVTMLPEHVPYLTEMYRSIIHNFDVRFVAFNKVVNHWPTKYNLQELEKALVDLYLDMYSNKIYEPNLKRRLNAFKSGNTTQTRRTCGAGWGSIHIGVSGIIYACHKEAHTAIGHIDSGINKAKLLEYRKDDNNCHLCPVQMCGSCWIDKAEGVQDYACRVEVIRWRAAKKVYEVISR